MVTHAQGLATLEVVKTHGLTLSQLIWPRARTPRLPLEQRGRAVALAGDECELVAATIDDDDGWHALAARAA